MKRGAGLLGIVIGLVGMAPALPGQDCTFDTPLSDFAVDTVCAPVTATWTLSYANVNHMGSDVQVRFDWGDGMVEDVNATELNPPSSTFEATGIHVYASSDEQCSFTPTAALVVNGLPCELSTQEARLKVWGSDNFSGGELLISPEVHEVCAGDSVNLVFTDNSMFNCSAPLEDDQPNTETRWIQWVYGSSSSLSGSSVRVDGVEENYPFEGEVIKLEGPVGESGLQSLPIALGKDHLAGEEFELELRYWNYCNPYEPGAPEPYVSERALIRIIALPDASIAPVDPLCESDTALQLVAATPGGTWSGPAVDPEAGVFSALEAGIGVHEITYLIPAGASCIAGDTLELVVQESPQAQLTPPGLLSTQDLPLNLVASPPGGSWWGPGITDAAQGTFDPSLAGAGQHWVSYTGPTTGEECPAFGQMRVGVAEPPFAEFITADSIWCSKTAVQSMVEIQIVGSDSSSFDLVIQLPERRDTLFIPAADTLNILMTNQFGDNIYRLVKLIEYHEEGAFLEQVLTDALVLQVNEIPAIQLDVDTSGLCSPVQASFSLNADFQNYHWDFGDGEEEKTTLAQAVHTYAFSFEDAKNPAGASPAYLRKDTAYTLTLVAETAENCRDSISYDIPVHPMPMASFMLDEAFLSYPDSVVQITNLSSEGDWSYLWDFGDGVRSTVRDPFVHVYEDWGSFDVSLQVFGEECRDTAREALEVAPPPPRSEFESLLQGCPPFETSFRNTSSFAETYLWDFGDGSSSTESQPSHIYLESGQYTVSLIASGESGSDTTEQLVEVYDTPEVHFQVSPEGTEDLLEVFSFTNESTGASYYLWDFGDGFTSTQEHPTHIYGTAGTYTVSLFAGNENDCLDTLVKQDLIQVLLGEGSTEFPTAFRWNGSGPSGGRWEEGKPDVTIFHPQVVNVREFRMYIYSRWGDKVFETNELYIGWDGYLNDGVLATEGVYVYKAWVKYVDGHEEHLFGDITFLH